MSDLSAMLWELHQSQIQILHPKRAFLSLDLRDVSKSSGSTNSRTTDFDGSLWQEPIQEWMQTHAIESFFLFLNRQREESWQNPPVQQHYQELVSFQQNLHFCKGCVWKKNIRTDSEIAHILKTEVARPLEILATQQEAAVLSSHQAFSLKTVCIPKPWGFEEWYTGVEKRGIVEIRTAEGATELPYALALFRQAYLKNHPEQLILLKTLNPVAEEVLGDLYLEMHEQKWEVYIVIEIDHQAWPSGEGIIKAGLHAEKVREYQKRHGEQWAKPYLQDFENQILAYQKIRRTIDQQLDKMRKTQAIALNTPLSPEQTQTFLETIPREQQKEEKRLRDQLYRFVGDLKVSVGDIIAFPTHQMHSLQHGIRVIEFQTPHYERLIVMFGQKVLTQDHWDTTQALAVMKPEVYFPPQLEELEKTKTRKVERFVEFPDFSADRITIAAQSEYSDQTGEGYHLLIGVTGEGTLHSSAIETPLLQPKEGWFLPASLDTYTIRNTCQAPLVYLRATPKL